VQQNAERVKATFFQSSAPAEQTPHEPEVHYKEILAHDCNGTTDLGEMDANFDDDYDKEDDVAIDGPVKMSVMKDFM
jgi:hypothetical protein